MSPAPRPERRRPAPTRRILAALAATFAVVSAAPGCAVEERSRQDFERHQMSMLEPSRIDPSVLVFETKVDARYPLDSEAAEQVRMRWLQGWLDRSGYCPDGYDILARRPIPPGEINFHHMDLRYELRCRPPPAE